jgi:Leucine-rich repeat (LRR) protein
MPANELETYKAQAQDLVMSLEFALNTLGGRDATPKEKDVIINQSFTKFFQDNRVQIEDDLDENREIVTNKNVQAYLKDVDFFFRDVKFEFNIDDISHFVTTSGQLFFKVTMNRNLQGETLDGKTVNTNRVRYIEINLDRERKDLKIASIYTTRLSEAEELRSWWDALPVVWQGTFKRKMTMLDDTLTFTQIKRIVSQQELDLSGSTTLTDLRPLSKLTDLRSLNVSGLPIEDIVPLRNLTKLEVLNVSNTRISDLSPLRYSTNLKEIDCSGTLIGNLEPVRFFINLERLYCHSLPLSDLSPVSQLANLKDLRFQDTPVATLEPLRNVRSLEFLRFSFTQVSSLQPLASLANLERVYFDNTAVADLQPLSGLKDLKIVFGDNTKIRTLAPLNGLPALERVYCDNTGITREEASRFTTSNPKVLVVYDSERLTTWWKQLPSQWQGIFSRQVTLDPAPTKEQLQTVANLTQINIAGNTQISDLNPLQELINLKNLDCSGTAITSLEPLKALFDLNVLNCANTPLQGEALESIRGLINLKELYVQGTQISTLPARSFEGLEVLNIDNTPVASLASLKDMKALRALYCDGAKVSAAEARTLGAATPTLLVVYRTAELETWWKGVAAEWQGILGKAFGIQETYTREQLHAVTSMTVLVVEDQPRITDLSPLREFIGLRELKLSNTRVSDLSPLANMLTLEVLECPRNPVSSLQPLVRLTKLTLLNCENTPVADLRPLAGLVNLEELKCSGTQVRDLRPLAGLTKLKFLEAYNTGIKSLKPLMGLSNLKTLVIYNTKVSAKAVDAFKAARPQCDVVHY